MIGAAGAPFVLAIGDPLIALMPNEPIGIDAADSLAIRVGGAEINTAIGVRRLGVAAGWLGRVGDDPFGRRVLATLEREGVERALAIVDPDAPTGLYVREWLADGRRRPYYYRRGAAGARLAADDWPQPWPHGVPLPNVVHATGITLAISATSSAALHAILDRAVDAGATISIDPNYRPALWPDATRAREALAHLARRADLLLLSEDDARALFGSDDPVVALAAAGELGASTVVFKRGARGAVVRHRGRDCEIAAAKVAREVDPVGAGDAFNAGFLAAIARGLDAELAARCGAWCGARAVECVGENDGYPTLADLPEDLRVAVTASTTSIERNEPRG